MDSERPRFGLRGIECSDLYRTASKIGLAALRRTCERAGFPARGGPYFLNEFRSSVVANRHAQQARRWNREQKHVRSGAVFADFAGCTVEIQDESPLALGIPTSLPSCRNSFARHENPESEWRLILNFNSAACQSRQRTATGTDVLLFAIPPACLLSVTVGLQR